MARPLFGILSTLILLFINLSNAHAEPYFAVMADAQCSHCHVNRTGGGMRNDHGVLLYSEFPLEATAKVNEEFKGRINKFLAVGADLRVQNLSTVESPRANSFTVPVGALHVAFDPVSHLTVYADTDLANLASREAVGIVHGLPAKGWIKFGRFNLPYGLRVPDDSAFIRGDLGFSFTTQDIGLEVGVEPGPVTLALAATNGVGGGPGDDNNAKAVSWFSEWRVFERLRFGGSFFYNDAAARRVLTGGGHAGAHWGPLALLGEYDIQKVRNKTTATERLVRAGYAEVDYRVIQGVVLRGIYDGEDDEIAGSGLHHRIGGGVDFFPIRNLKTQLLYRYRIGPDALGLGSDQILVVFHGYL